MRSLPIGAPSRGRHGASRQAALRRENRRLSARQILSAATGGSSGKRGVFLWDWETLSSLPTSLTGWRPARPPGTASRTATDGRDLRGIVCARERVPFSTMLDPERGRRSFHRVVRFQACCRTQRIPAGPSRRLCFDHSGALRRSARRAIENSAPAHFDNSEPLLDGARAAALEAWGINIHNSWGSVEIGLAASEGESFDGMMLAEDFLIFEAVNIDNRPVADLAREKVLVTKLYGTVMPLIRYELWIR